MNDLDYCKGYVDGWFDDDAKKIQDWWASPSNAFGGVSPLAMVEMGNEKRIRQWIETRKMAE